MKAKPLSFVFIKVLVAGIVTGGIWPANASDLEKLSDEELIARIERLEKRVGSGTQNATRSGSKVRVTLNGQINQAVRYTSDGTNTALQVIDNDVSSSRFRLLGVGQVNDDLTIKTTFEFDLETNPRDELDISDDINFSALIVDPDGANLELRKAEVIFDSERFGTLYLGQGNTFSNTTIEQDFSQAALATGNFSNSDSSLTFQIADGAGAFNDVGSTVNPADGLSRATRIRYDTPAFAGGFKLGATYVSEKTYDIGIDYRNDDLSGFAVKGRAAYFAFLEDDAIAPTNTQTQAAGGSLAILHKATGISVSGLVQGFIDNALATPDEDEFFGWGIKGGIQRSLLSVGDTSFAVDFLRTKSTPAADEFLAVVSNQLRGFAFGVNFNQKIDKLSTQLYAGYHMFKVQSDLNDNDAAPIAGVDPLHIVTMGALIKF